MANDKLKKMSKKRQQAHQAWLSFNSGTYKGFLQMEQDTYCDGALSKKVKELIAVGISVTMNCESCMQWHVEQAAKDGATLEELLEAIEVGMEMGGGPATASARFTLDVMKDIGLIQED